MACSFSLRFHESSWCDQKWGPSPPLLGEIMLALHRLLTAVQLLGVTRCPSLCGTAQHFIALSPLFHMLRQCPKFFLALQYLQFSKVWLLMHVKKAGKAFSYVQVEVSLSEPICAHQGKNSPEMNVTETTSKKMKRQWEIQFFFNFTQRKMWPEVTHK